MGAGFLHCVPGVESRDHGSARTRVGDTARRARFELAQRQCGGAAPGVARTRGRQGATHRVQDCEVRRMNSLATSSRSPRRVAAWIAAALFAIAPFGALVSQETPKPATPADTQPAPDTPPTAKKSPASAKTGDATPKPAATTSKPADASTAKSATAKPAANKPATDTAKASTDGDQADKDIDKAQAPTIFVPSQKTSADNSATFPIDI